MWKSIPDVGEMLEGYGQRKKAEEDVIEYTKRNDVPAFKG